jgi:predicted nucleotidyltransferase
MRREDVLRCLHDHELSLRNDFHVKSLDLFGSVARDEAGPGSDVDLLVEFNRPTGYFGLVRLQLFLQQLLGCEVDLGTFGSLRPAMRERVEKEAIRVAWTMARTPPGHSRRRC